MGPDSTGTDGPATDVMAWRAIGIFGYAVVFPITCLALSRAFPSAPSPSAADPPEIPVSHEFVMD